jgi:hypothetical protein
VTPAIILATWQIVIVRIEVQGQPGQIVHKTPEQNGLEVWPRRTPAFQM